MQVLIVDDDIVRQTELSIAFIEAGFQTNGTASHCVAERCIRQGCVDLLILSERVDGRLTHFHALLAELCNPMVATIMLTDDQEIDELFLLLPSLHCLLAPDSDPKLVTKLSIASVIGATRRSAPILLKEDQRIDEPVAAVPIFTSTRIGARSHEPERRYA